MVEFELRADVARRVRFGLSPAQELFHAIQAAEAVPESRALLETLDVQELRLALCGPAYAPDFLTPPPSGATTSFEAQVSVARATPPKQVRRELELAFADRAWPAPLDRDATVARDLLVGQFARCWVPLMARRWPMVRSLLEADVAHRAQQYASGGVAVVLDGLHPSVRLVDGVLVVRSDHPEPIPALDERGLLLLPTLFGPEDRVGPVLVGFWQPTLVYPARGRGLLVDTRLPLRGADSPLSQLMGRTRALLVEALSEPSTTTTLSELLGLAPSTVSEHLQALVAAGVAAKRRQGRSVIYALTALGRSLDP